MLVPYMQYIKVAISFVVLSLVFWGGCSVQKNKDAKELYNMRTTIQQKDLEASKIAQETSEWKRLTTEKYLATLAEIDKNYTKELNDVEEARNSAISNLRADNLRLRDRFKCTEGSTTTAPTSSVDAGKEAGGLTEADAEFLIWESANADKVKVQLNALIEWVESISK